jgi:hypothetical protein
MMMLSPGRTNSAARRPIVRIGDVLRSRKVDRFRLHFEKCAAVFLGDETLALENLQVLANGDLRDLEEPGEMCDFGTAFFLKELDDFESALVRDHGDGSGPQL